MTSPTALAPFPGFFQVAYVTEDMDRAQRLFADTHRIPQFLEMRDMRYQTQGEKQAHCHISLAYVGAVEIELIQPLSGDVELYRDYLPRDGSAVRLHHLCRRFETEAEYDAQIEAFTRMGKRFPINGKAEGVGRYFYCDFRAELGHYVEGIFFEPGTRPWLDSIPRT